MIQMMVVNIDFYQIKFKISSQTSSESQSQLPTPTVKSNQKKGNHNLMNLNRRLTKMTIVIAIQSFFAHIATFIDTLMFLIFDNTLIAHHLTLINFFLVSCKQIGNFVCFYYLNTDLRNEIKQSLSKLIKAK